MMGIIPEHLEAYLTQIEITFRQSSMEFMDNSTWHKLGEPIYLPGVITIGPLIIVSNCDVLGMEC